MKTPSTDASYFLVLIEQDKSQADSSRVVHATLGWMFTIQQEIDWSGFQLMAAGLILS